MDQDNVMRVLQITDGLGSGVIPKGVPMLYYRHIDRSKVQFDWAIFRPCSQQIIDEVKSMGSIVYQLPSRTQKLPSYLYELAKVVKKGKYKIVHIHRDHSASIILDALAAKLSGAKVVIGHVHNTTFYESWKRKLHVICRPIMNMILDKRCACSEPAGKWGFKNAKFTVINNAIELDDFYFDSDARKKYRKELGVGDELLLGDVARLVNQKNLHRLIDIFKAVSKKADAKLVLVGEGPERESLEAQVKENGLTERVIFTGRREDVPKLLSAMDIYVMPSLFEGMSVASIEAQACGLPCVFSAEMPSTQIISCVRRVSLNSSDEEWAKTILEINHLEDRGNVKNAIHAAGYDIETEAPKLQQFYEDCLKE